ncbi:7SK snRNA methylphosphate capping enzyme-like [Osmerus mordax]|uniref:7SK snRNA methylphosphate capping enzyme-like n=1 Tax=Osmerus mordax TaxID=8014 RepID=UPI003510803C
MIEMSVDKESVTTGSTKANSTPTLQLQQLSECTGSYNNASTMTEVSLANSGITDGASASPTGLAGGIQKKQTSPADSHNQAENVGVRVNEKPLNTHNGLQQSKQQQQQQQQQPQKLSKRRSTSTIGFKHPPSGKRRRRANSESDSVLPTNFLLGGNIFDPLNLNSLLDEEVNRALNAETPKSSPLPAKSRDPVEILIPRDITDPLNLNSGMTSTSFLVSPFKRRRHRHRHHGGGGGGVGGGGGGVGGGGGGSAGPGSTSAPHLDASDSERASDVNTGTSSLPSSSSAPASEVALKGSSALSSVPGSSLCDDEPKPSICKEEAVLPVSNHPSQPRGPEEPCTVTGGPNQHTSRPRKRRRNSGKTEPPFSQSTPVGKPSTEDRSRGAATGRSIQTFHTPVTGSKPGPGGRHQRKQQQHPQQQRMKFQYGNYSQYYGYRNPGFSEDPRFRVLRPEWFQGKEVLDLGCNTGQLTLCIAKKLRPARILGLDIDGALVHAARQNIRHYLSEMKAQEARRAAGAERPAGQEGEGESKEQEEENRTGRGIQRDVQNRDKLNPGEATAENGDAVGRVERESVSTEPADQGEPCPAPDGGREERRAGRAEHGDSDGAPVDPLGKRSFPVSLRISRGPIAAPPLPENPPIPPGDFPANVSFVKANYVLESDALLETQRPEYDIILCLSVTKWVHLNWGDSGLKRLFHRVYRHLRPGGRFILEPQPWDTYGKRKKLSDSIFRNYHGICLRPDQFSTYLISEVGFSSYELIGTPKSSSKGFERPIYLFYK